MFFQQPASSSDARLQVPEFLLETLRGCPPIAALDSAGYSFGGLVMGTCNNLYRLFMDGSTWFYI